MSDSSNAVQDVPRARIPAEQDSGSDVLGGGSARTRGTGNLNGPEAWVPPAVVAGVRGVRAHRRWRAARDVCDTITRIRKPRPEGMSRDQWLRDMAADILRKDGPTGNDGALGELRGHLFELLDIRDYNARREGGYHLKQLPDPHNRDYDAIRLDADDHFAGGVQLKLGSSGIQKAINNLEARIPGSAAKATFRVPRDRLGDAEKRAQGRTRVRASRLRVKTVARIEDRGLRTLVAHGEAAVSPCRQAARAAGLSAAAGAVAGGLVDLRAFLAGDLNPRQFAARRGVDATQAGITAVGTAATISGVTASAAFLAKKAAPGSLAARVMGTVAASTVVAPAVVAVVVACDVSFTAGFARRYVTDRFGSSPRAHTNDNSPGE